MLTEKLLSQCKKDMKTGRLPVEHQTLSDAKVQGLRVIIRRDGPAFYTFQPIRGGKMVHVAASTLAKARQMAMPTYVVKTSLAKTLEELSD